MSGNMPTAAKDTTKDATENPIGLTGAQIRHARSKRGETQEQLARRLDVRSMTVSEWERGKNPCSPAYSERIAAAYETTVRALIKAADSAAKREASKKDAPGTCNGSR